MREGAESNSSGKLDDRWLVFDLFRRGDGLLDTFKVMISILHPLSMPSISLETLQDILGKGTLGITICQLSIIYRLISTIMLTDGYMIIVIDHDEIA